MSRMLVGVRVLDLSRHLPGPFCTQLLADLGAEVLKVEMPETGDDTRASEMQIRGQGASFLMLNRGKKSMTLNLKAKIGPEIFRRLAGRSDVVVESFRPGVTKRLGIDYKRLKRDNPKLIYASITGYGQDGPYAARAGHDINFLATSGLGMLTGTRGKDPVQPALQAGDITGGAMMAAFSIMGALYQRERTGRGQYIDVSMLDGLMAMGQNLFGEFLASGKSPGPGETRLGGGNPVYAFYKTKDGSYLALGCLEKKFWNTFCEKAGREDMKSLHATASGKDCDMVEKELTKLIKTKTREEWTKLLADEDSCCTPVLSMEEAMKDPHLASRGIVVDGVHPDGDKTPMVGFPVKFSEAETVPPAAPPRLGEHTDEMLQSAGYSKKEIEQLKKDGVV